MLKATTARRTHAPLPLSGHRHISKNGHGWQVRIRVDGKLQVFGTRATIDEAVRLRDTVLKPVTA